MKNKSLLKFVVAFGLLAIVLIFLGVNYVPRIYASVSDNQNSVSAAQIPASNIIDKHLPRAYRIQPNYVGSDWVERHPPNYYSNSDFAERHPSYYYTNSDWVERHP